MDLSRKLLSGVLFLILGGGAAFIASHYRMGSIMNMGPGYFPVLVGLVTAAIGLVLMLQGALASGEGDRVLLRLASLRGLLPLLVILVSVLIFAMLIRTAGLVAAIVAIVLVSRLAKWEGTVRELIVMLVVLPVIALLIFVYGLNMPLRLWPWS